MTKIKDNMNKFILILFLGASMMAIGQVSPSYHVTKKPVSLGAGLTLTTTDINKPVNGNPLLNEKSSSAKLYLKLDLGEDYVNTDGEFEYKADFIITATGTSFSNSYTINISQTDPEQILEIDLLNEMNLGATEIVISSASVSIDPNINATPLVTKNYVINNLALTATFVREYEVDVRLTNNTMAPGVHLSNPTQNGRLVTFVWEVNSSENFPNYEVQILRLYNTDQTKATNNSEVTAEVDWNKALRVETQSPAKEITLNIAEGTGFYIWRVRPIGNFYPGGIANQENYGVWNTSSIAQGTTEVLTLTDLPSRNDVFYVNDPDENINWIYNRVFTEGNQDPTNSKAKVSEGMSYADGLLRARQTQAFNSSNNTTLVTQTVSDYSGRPALTTLPVPVGDGLTGYKLGFVKNTTTNTLYTAADYDNGTNITDPQVINQTSEFAYYNGQQDDGVAAAEGYPFKRTLFKTDGTGRVDEESGVGKMHALGTQGGTLGGGRTTRILFGTPSDEELIRIFGDEAPLAESVIKTLTIDPNNVVSTTYTSKEGKTIATALISNGTANLLPLDLKNLSTFIVNNTANQNIVSNNKMISSRRIALEVAKDVTLSYTSALPSMGACAGGDCKLKVRFFLNDLKNGATYVSNANNVADPDFPNYFSLSSTLDFTAYPTWVWEKLDPSSQNPPIVLTRTATGSSFNLASGEYIITKEVFSTNEPNFVEENMITQSEKYAPVLNALADKIASIVNATDYAIFQSTWLPALNTLISTYQGTANTTNSDAILLHLGLVRDNGSLNYPHDVAIDYLVPIDISFTNLSQDAGDPQQNTFTMTIGPGQENGGCCPPMPIAVPKPEICPACEGKEEGIPSNPLVILSAIEASVDASIAGNLALVYGIEDVKNNGGSIFITNNVQNNNSSIWNSTYNSIEYRIINKIVGYEFMNYLYQKLYYEGFMTTYNPSAPNTYNPSADPYLQGHLNRFAPGFTYTSLQYMITNMLVSRYYTGKSKDGYRARENEATGFLEYIDDTDPNNVIVVSGSARIPVNGIDDGNDFNYKCKQLFECWVQAVDLLNAFEFDDDLNVMNSFNDEQGGGAAEDHADDDDSKEEDDGSWVMDQILEMVISAKLRKFQNSDEGTVPKERLEAMVSLPKVFMECAGYYYANILDETTTLPADYSVNFIPSGIDPLIIMDFTGGWGVSSSFGTQTPILVSRKDDGSLYDSEDDNVLLPEHVIAINCGTCPESPQLYYPYTLKPEWLFKYFVYNAYHDDNDDQQDDDGLDFAPVLNQFQLELDVCYADIFQTICGNDVQTAVNLIPDENNDPDDNLRATENPRCSGEECRYYHESWSAGQRLNFYQQLQGRRKCPEICTEGMLDGITVTPFPACEKVDCLVPSANLRLDDMIAVCDYRRGQFKSNLISELVNGCWEIVKCSTETYHITEAQINSMVDKVVASCKAQVNGVRTKLNSWNGLSDYTGDGIADAPIGGYGPLKEVEYPTIRDHTCFYVDLSDRSCKSDTKRNITFFPECDQLTLDQVSKWNFEPSIGVADFDGDGICGVNADGTLIDPNDANGDINSDGIPNCTSYVNRNWNTTSTVACTEHTNCLNVRCVQVAPVPAAVNTYSTTHNIPKIPAP